MTFLSDVQELKTGLIIFRRTDVQHHNWYCRIKVPDANRYKTISLKTHSLDEARDKAFDHDADIRFRVKHDVPVFEKSFAQVATEYSDFQKGAALSGQIKMKRWKCIESYIRCHLIPYLGNAQIAMVGEDKWKGYPLWRKQRFIDRKKKNRLGKAKPEKTDSATEEAQAVAPVKEAGDETIRHEMQVFRAIMNFAADKGYIRERQVPKSKLLLDRVRRDEFTPEEYRQLHTFARKWVKEGKTDYTIWYRTMAYNFMLIMCNIGMRPPEAGNLRWRDIAERADNQGRKFICINVRGKDKYRELVAAQNVSTYLERIRNISKATNPDDFVFTNQTGKPSATLYDNSIENLLKDSGLLLSSSGKRRSTYCFRHTYATFRLMEGVDVYFLAKQMGTSVKMIEDHYGHITPAKNAERILQGLSGWEPVAGGSGGTSGSVNADGAGTKPTKPRTKK